MHAWLFAITVQLMRPFASVRSSLGESRARKLRFINYQRLMRASLNAQRRAISFFASEPRQWDGHLVFSWHEDGPEATKRHRPRSSHSRLFARNRFTLMAMLRCASRLSKLLKQSIYTQIRPHGRYLFFLSPFFSLFFIFIFPSTFLRWRFLLGSAVVFAYSNWLRW